uniref:Uncharacterized protein n=1 Tax=Brassica oleracea TaxID=3712 RepID=A0A3P6DCI8_BRAOL|nr:unnamed protein product [Brassica oleracea]
MFICGSWVSGTWKSWFCSEPYEYCSKIRRNCNGSFKYCWDISWNHWC